MRELTGRFLKEPLDNFFHFFVPFFKLAMSILLFWFEGNGLLIACRECNLGLLLEVGGPCRVVSNLRMRNYR